MNFLQDVITTAINYNSHEILIQVKYINGELFIQNYYTENNSGIIYIQKKLLIRKERKKQRVDNLFDLIIKECS